MAPDTPHDALQNRLDAGLNAENDIDYLLSLIGNTLEDEHAHKFENDAERAEWAVAAWSQELQYQPDLRDYSTGQCLTIGDVPDDLETARYRERRDEEEAAQG